MKLLLFSIIYGAVHVRWGASTPLEPFRGWGNKGGSQKVPTSATVVLRDPTTCQCDGLQERDTHAITLNSAIDTKNSI